MSTSATIVHRLLAKLARHPKHRALCAVLRAFLNEMALGMCPASRLDVPGDTLFNDLPSQTWRFSDD